MVNAEPDTLYHYTTANSLYSILTGQEIWLTDHRFLNDRKEFTFAAEVYKKALATLDPNIWLDQLNSFPKAQEDFKENLSRLNKGWFGLSFEAPSGYQTYVFSLSDDPDSLAQWRAYGNGEVCIGFRRNILIDNGDTQKALRKIKYLSEDNLDAQVDEIKAMLDKYVSDTLIGSQFPSMYFNNKPILDCAFIKHDGFHTEREWRLLKWSPNPDNDFRKNYRPSGRYIVPCYKMSIDPGRVISEIVFGPEADPDVVDNLRRLLGQRFPTVPPHYKISQSKIPYRT